MLMKEKEDFLTNILLSIILPLVVSGGGATALVLFQESLPPILFITLLWVLCLFTIIVIVRLAFSDSINTIIKVAKNKIYQRKRYKLANDWSENFQKLSNIVSIVSDKDWEPTEEQSRKYHILRVWFRRNRSEFLPRWYSFIKNRTRTAYEANNRSLEYKILSAHWTDPFSCFYDPLDLKRMSIFLEDEFGTNEGDALRYALIRLQELTDEFTMYIKRMQW